MSLSSIHRGISKDEVYSTNRAAILRAIHTCGRASQEDIVETTGLKQPTVSNIVRELLEAEIVYKVDNKKKSRGKGRPPKYFSLTTDLFVLSIRVARNEVLSSFVGLGGEVCKKRHYVTAGIDSAKDLYKLLKEIINSRLNPSSTSGKTIVGIGIVVPGPLNILENRIALVTEKRGWTGINLGDLGSLSELPIVVGQDADGAVLGEHIFGVAQKETGVIFIAAGRGVGAGMLINSSIVKGCQGFSGEFGHTSVEADGIPCECGNKGCVERYSSINSLLRYLKGKSRDNTVSYDSKTLGFDDVIKLTRAGNEEVVEAVERAAYYLGIGIANLVNLLAPSLIVLGDEMVQLGSVWVDEVKETVKKRAIDNYCGDLQIVASESGEDVFLEGAGALMFDRFLENPDYLVEGTANNDSIKGKLHTDSAE